MAELHHTSHRHPLVFKEDTAGTIDTKHDCAGCAKPVSGSSYGCTECGFYLHKRCAEAPSEIHHPAHREHPLLLLPPSQHPETGVCCKVCYKKAKGFIYHCSSSCEIYLDIDCALLPCYTSVGNLDETLYAAHPHPLVSINPIGCFNCMGCRDPLKVNDASYACFDCKMFAHKKCLELPTEIRHPCHREHRLVLLFSPPSLYWEREVCSFCYRELRGFVYHCSSCGLYLDLNCAFLPQDIGAGNFFEISHVAHAHPLIPINPAGHLKCNGCFCQINEASYACFDCTKLYHKKCLQLPTSIYHPCHRKHQLMLDFKGADSVCNLCRRNFQGEFFYRCVPCKIDIHAGCAWPPPVIEDKSHHDHPFTLLLRPNNPFFCNACGDQGDYVSYICSTCNIQVHKDCTSLPRHITLRLHPHPLSHCFFHCIDHNDPRTWDCKICFENVNIEHGSYYCSRPGCDFVIHVQCSIKKKNSYSVFEVENLDEFEEPDPLYKPMSCIIRIIKEIKVGDDVIAGEIEHVSHEHKLVLSNEIKENTFCNGCVLPLLSSFYCCPHCDFFIHKTCAELPRKYQPWSGFERFSLRTDGIFICRMCRYYHSGFYYKLDRSSNASYSYICIKCASRSHSFTYKADQPHFIFYVENHEGKCNACCEDLRRDYGVYRCKDCTFGLHERCLTLPRTVRHKCDQHSLTLAYQDPDDYPLRHYCDICEERRDPRKWYYRCESCDNALHIRCVLGKDSFIKAGTKYTYIGHPHPLTFVRKMYYYPECNDCGEPCQDLALVCEEHGCKYIVHWTCIVPKSLMVELIAAVTLVMAVTLVVAATLVPVVMMY
ncbi:uncharacterized protein LOC120187385 [Hibiscus syriacus]|uniref:uncharacterized protein LOC120187385 n=1 Tax=Hibiscus syriacus TaxID=106335 RepID=UPI0019237052|nr:uncharacterized protein LOC120187385 [Hibiscus syriacus]